ncbi:MAG: peptidoglycan editing factor PgeF [Acidimicrobiia bacterium]|nr:peptidoglycan editing factor PgeF [Acidimicrobiia bacterium]
MDGDGRAYSMGERAGVGILTWALLADQPVDALVTTRHGGVSAGPYARLNLGLHVGDDPAAVRENRRRAAAALGLRLEDLVFCNQAHGRAVAVVGAEHGGRGTTDDADAIDGVDALVTTTRGLGLVAMVADCAPIVLVDPGAGVLACVHAGWRGTVARVAEAAVETMGSLGATPGSILAAIGPAVAPERYQVGHEVAAAARAGLGPASERVVRPDGPGRWLFDLRSANRVVLEEAGVKTANIVTADVPSDDEHFYSDRARRPCGRFAVLAALRPRGKPL